MNETYPTWTNYIATDECGEVWAYEHKPFVEEKDSGIWTASVDGNRLCEHLYTINSNKTDWKESLVTL